MIQRMASLPYECLNIYNKVLFNVGITISFGFGIWHFFIPLMFHWFQFIDPQYISLINSVRWINILFSVFLTGISLILFINRKFITKQNRFAISVYSLFIFVWIVRVVITVIFPFNGVYDWMFWIMTCVFVITLVSVGIPYVQILIS